MVKSTSTTSEPKNDAAASSAQPADSPAASPRPRVESDCVVDADFHVGRAVPGTKVCSYHTMHYAADGSRRK